MKHIEKVVGFGVAAGLLVGCSPQEPNYPEILDQHAPYSGTVPEAVISLELPKELPAPVKEREQYAIKVATVANLGSGVIVEDVTAGPSDNESHYVLTAGHVYSADKSSKIMRTGCVTGNGKILRYNQALPGDHIARQDIVGAAGEFNEDSALHPDDAVLRMKGDQPALTTDAFESAPRTGEKVFFTNYQVTAKNTIRNVDDPMAVYGGTILRVTDKNIYVATDQAAKGYNRSEDNTLHHGGSGGPVWNAQGDFVGLSNQAVGEDTHDGKSSVPVKAIEDYYKVNITDAKDSANMTIAVLNRVSPTKLQSLEKAVEPCTP